jgi:hypothetical protein
VSFNTPEVKKKIVNLKAYWLTEQIAERLTDAAFTAKR